jgi:hypothetical protein
MANRGIPVHLPRAVSRGHQRSRAPEENDNNGNTRLESRWISGGGRATVRHGWKQSQSSLVHFADADDGVAVRRRRRRASASEVWNKSIRPEQRYQLCMRGISKVMKKLIVCIMGRTLIIGDYLCIKKYKLNIWIIRTRTRTKWKKEGSWW